MTSNDLKELVDVSRQLLNWRKELERYESEAYLCEEVHRPWINVTIGNHPTHLAELTVGINKPERRDIVRHILVVEMKAKIRSLETKLRYLKGK